MATKTEPKSFPPGGAEIINVSTVPVPSDHIIDTQVTTAKRYPRDVAQAIRNVLAIATDDQEIAAECIYSLPPRKKADGTLGKPIEGPSVRLAELFVQEWGNLRAEIKVGEPGERRVTSTCAAWDLEKNTAVSVEVTRSIIGKYGRYTDSMVETTAAAASSIAFRNGVFKIIPAVHVLKVYAGCKRVIAGDTETLPTRRKKAIEAWVVADVTEKEILKALGKKKITNITAQDLATLVGWWTSVKEGRITKDEIFRPRVTEEVAPEDLGSDALARKLKESKDDVGSDGGGSTAADSGTDTRSKKVPYLGSITTPSDYGLADDAEVTDETTGVLAHWGGKCWVPVGDGDGNLNL